MWSKRKQETICRQLWGSRSWIGNRTVSDSVSHKSRTSDRHWFIGDLIRLDEEQLLCPEGIKSTLTIKYNAWNMNWVGEMWGWGNSRFCNWVRIQHYNFQWSVLLSGNYWMNKGSEQAGNYSVSTYRTVLFVSQLTLCHHQYFRVAQACKFNLYQNSLWGNYSQLLYD